MCGFRTFPYMRKNLECNIDLHNTALKSLALSPSVFFDKNPTGRLINRFSKDIGVVDGPLQHYLYEAISSSLFIIGSIITMIIIIPINLAILPLMFLNYFLILKYVAPLILEFRKIELIARGPMLSTINSALNGLPTLRCLKLQELFKAESEKHAENHMRAYITFHIFMRFIQFYSDLGASFIIVLNVILIVGISNYVSPDLAAFSLSSSVSLLGMSSIWSKNVVETSSNMSSAQRLLEFADLLPEGELEIDKEFKITKGFIEFQNVYMRYRPNFGLALSGLTCQIEAGHKIGIIGRTGAGKSSILQVLFRLINPESGTVYIDGQDFMQIGLHQLRGQMSVIPQSSVLFAASIRDNLDPFNHHTDEELIDVLNEVKLKDFVLDYDMGLYTEIKGDGINFSAGQKQLLCLARAILRNNKIVMMDEATANVDNETDRVIQETVKRKFIGCSLLIIAHRLRTIINSDKIIVIDKGICKEYATPLELYNKDDSIFRSMIFHTGPEESQYLITEINKPTKI